MFDVEFRDRVMNRVLELAQGDRRIVAGAVVGSLALTDGDRFSDLDLTFAVADAADLTAVLDDWADILRREYRADTLFDVVSGASIYRVFLLPGALQVDLSVTPATSFGPRAVTFRLLFGAGGVAAAPKQPRSCTEIAGYAAHHALRARVSIERGRALQAGYWLSELRNEVLALTAARHGAEAFRARGAHLLPDGTVPAVSATLVRSFEEPELWRALRAGIELLLAETASSTVSVLPESVRAQLAALATGAAG
jgi:hypothetical protein